MNDQYRGTQTLATDMSLLDSNQNITEICIDQNEDEEPNLIAHKSNPKIKKSRSTEKIVNNSIFNSNMDKFTP